MKNRTNVRDFAQKKTYSVSSATLYVEDFDGTNAIEIFNLPEKCLVTNVFTVAEVAGNSGLTLKVDIGSTTVLAAGDVDTVNDIAEAETNLVTETGKNVKVIPSVAVTSGVFVVIVQYVEYTLNNGTLTNYTNS